MPEKTYDINDIFEIDSPFYNGALEFATTPNFQNAFEDGIDPRIVGGQETGENLLNLGKAQSNITVNVGESIQDAIDKLVTLGGGTILIKNGTHIVESDITLSSNIYIIGENADGAIIDFNSSASQIKIVGSDAYSTGTISVSNGSTAVTGDSTVWSTNATAGQHILLDHAWYPIAVVGNNTSITLAIPFAGVTLAGGTVYAIATTVKDVKITNLTIQLSTIAAIKVQYTNETFFEDVLIIGCGQALDVDDASNFEFLTVDMVSCVTGMTLTNVGLGVYRDNTTINTSSGVGLTLDNVKNFVVQSSAILSSSGNGITVSNSSNFEIRGFGLVQNGGVGIEFSGNNSNINVDGISAESNSGDGVKLTATSDGIIMTGLFVTNNGGYGLNIANANCDNNIISNNIFSGNSSGEVTDSGTGTLIANNIGVADN